MGRNKKYSGYKAFQYLEPGTDYKEFKLRPAIVDEWWKPVPLSKSEEERFLEVMEKSIVIDLHAHADISPADISQARELDREGRNFLAYEALSMSGLDCVFDNMMDGSCFINTKHGWDWNSTVHDLGMRLADIAHQDFLVHCKKVDDIVEAHRDGRVAWVAVIESASCIENEVDRLDILYGLGVRSIGVNYSESNMLGSGLKERGDGGLTDFGYDALVRMNKLGILVDVSHVSDLTALDTIELSKKPIIVSHSGARALTPTTRMFPDEVIQALGESGGVMAIEAAPNLTVTEKHPLHGIDSYMEHIEYCIDFIGIDHVGCGPDTNYGDHVGLYLHNLESHAKEGLGHYARPDSGRESKYLGIDMDVEQLKKLRYVRGMENPSECLQNVARWMIGHGYSDGEIAKIVGGNGLRLLREVW
ncbi:MAG: membrane dipeptidase [Candidatus Bathyarchaeota archaeon]|nr:MAG: membrane dipeptidase [Candidatus Bathyarchaeota archaeon]